MSEKTTAQEMMDKLSYSKKNVFEVSGSEKIKAIFEYAEKYSEYICHTVRILSCWACLLFYSNGGNV